MDETLAALLIDAQRLGSIDALNYTLRQVVSEYIHWRKREEEKTMIIAFGKDNVINMRERKAMLFAFSTNTRKIH